MKLIKAIRLHRKLRKRQEYLCYEVCLGNHSYLNEYGAINKAVRNIGNKLPWAYFFISDIFGFHKSLRYMPNKSKKTYTVQSELIIFDIISYPSFKI